MTRGQQECTKHRMMGNNEVIAHCHVLLFILWEIEAFMTTLQSLFKYSQNSKLKHKFGSADHQSYVIQPPPPRRLRDKETYA